MPKSTYQKQLEAIERKRLLLPGMIEYWSSCQWGHWEYAIRVNAHGEDYAKKLALSAEKRLVQLAEECGTDRYGNSLRAGPIFRKFGI